MAQYIATASDFVIFDENRLNGAGVPYVWGGRYGFSTVTLLAHVYKDRAAAERAIKRNKRLRRDGIFYLTVDEFESEHETRIR